MLEWQLVIGEQVGNYRISEELGEGGMGTVYVAHHVLMGKGVAVKVLRTELSADEEVVARFFNEAKSASLVKHPGVIDIYDFGHHDSGSAYIVMELLEGEPLGELMKREGPLSGPQICMLMTQAAEALAITHERGIVHRDLKPDNIFVVPDSAVPGGQRAKVLDFGIAKLTCDESPMSLRTRTGALMGTPLYMSPEQCRGAGEVDSRSDIYSLGCILYEMACGRPPFVRPGFGEMITAHMSEPPPPPSSIYVDADKGLEAVILRALSKDPGERQQSMTELAAELDGLDIPASAPRSDATPAAVAKTKLPPRSTTLSGTASEAQSGDSPPSKRGRFVALAGASLVLVAAAGFVLFGQGGKEERAHPQGQVDSVAPEPEDSPSREAQTVAPSIPIDAAATQQPDRISVELRSQPKGAEVYRVADGVKLGTTPFETELVRGTGELVLVLKHRGYRDEVVEVPIDGDQKLSVPLEKATRLRPRRPARKRPKKPAESDSSKPEESDSSPPGDKEEKKTPEKERQRGWGDPL